MYENYAKIRNERGLKDADVSKATGISQGTLSDWKRRRYDLRADKLQKIADYLGVSIDYIVTGKEEKKTSDSGKEYYFSDETADMAERLSKRKDMRMLFHAVEDVGAEDLEVLYNMALALKRKERHEDTE